VCTHATKFLERAEIALLLKLAELEIPAPRIVKRFPEEIKGTTEKCVVYHPGLASLGRRWWELHPDAQVECMRHLARIIAKLREVPDHRKKKDRIAAYDGSPFTYRRHRKVRIDDSSHGKSSPHIFPLSTVEEMFKHPAYQYGFTCVFPKEEDLDGEYESIDGRKMFLWRNCRDSNTFSGLKDIAKRRWKLQFAHGSLTPETIVCTKDGEILEITHWQFAGWWPEYWDAVHATRKYPYFRYWAAINWWQYEDWGLGAQSEKTQRLPHAGLCKVTAEPEGPRNPFRDRAKRPTHGRRGQNTGG
jgi:hypothetical protein